MFKKIFTSLTLARLLEHQKLALFSVFGLKDKKLIKSKLT